MKKKNVVIPLGSKVDVVCSSTGKTVYTGVLRRLTTNKQFAYLYGRFNTENFPKIHSTHAVEINVAIENVRCSL